MLSLLYLLSVGLSRLDVWFLFPWVQRVDSVLCFGYHVVSSCFFGGLSVGNTWYRWNCRVTSRESSVSSAGVEFIVLWCYGPSILWIRLDGWFSRCRGQSPADWLSGRPCTKTMKGRSKSKRARTGREFSGVQESFKGCSRDVQERAFCDWRVVFNSPTWPCPRAACRIRLSVWGGAPPMSRLSGVDVQVIQYFIHSVEDTNLPIIYMFNNTWC